jgi:hypothetical protein
LGEMLAVQFARATKWQRILVPKVRSLAPNLAPKIDDGGSAAREALIAKDFLVGRE